MKSVTSQQWYTATMGVVTFIVTQLVAFIPTLGTDKQNLISGGGAIVSVAILIAGSLHHIASTRQPTKLPVVTQIAPSPAVNTLRQQVIDAGMTPNA